MTDRETDRQVDKLTDKNTERKRNGQTGCDFKQTERQTNDKRVRHTGR